MSDKMVWHAFTPRWLKLGRSNSHTTVDLAAIGADDFTAEHLSDREGPLTLSRGRGPDHCDERRIHNGDLGALRHRDRASDREKLLRIQGCPTHQRSVEIGLGSELSDILRFHGPAVEDPRRFGDCLSL